MKSVLDILKQLIPFRKWMAFNLLFNFLGMVFSIFSFAMIIPLLRILFTDQEELVEMAQQNVQLSLSEAGVSDYINSLMAQQIMDHGNTAVLIYICVVMVIMVLLKNACIYASSLFLSKSIHSLSSSLRERMHAKILRLDMAFFSDERKGDLISRFTADIREIEFSILASVDAAFKQPWYIIGYIVTLFVINVKLSLFIIIFLPVAGLIIALLGKSLKRNARAGQEEVGNLVSTAEESISGLKVLKGFNAESRAEERFNKQNRRIRSLMIRIFRVVDIASPASEVMGVMATSGVLLYGGSLVFNGALEADFFIGYLVMFSQLITPFKVISKATYESNRGKAALNRISEITDAEINIQDNPGAVAMTSFEREVHYKDVSFKYQNEWVLKNIDLKIEKGKSVALVGQSGSGKSTLADLLPRFYDVVSGSILIDGQNIREVKLRDLRGLMGIVTQQSILFNDTVFNNIALGVEEVSREAVIEAAKIANAHEFIEQLGQGYDTNIGDGGGKLSGGQRQRLSIARAVLKNPPILILDEATSALDTESEKLVQDALNKLMQNRTSLVIAHRLSTIQHADEIVVMHEGEVVERGTHTQLIEQGGTYKKLIDMQSFA